MKGETEVKTLETPLTKKEVKELEVGDLVKISGTIVTARDKAYKRILNFIEDGRKLPINLNGGIVYHCGPLVKSENREWEMVAAGPTTSARMDDMQAKFVEETGIRALIGKGGVGEKVASEISSLGCVYLAFPGGAAALASQKIESIKNVTWEDLGTAEAVWTLEVEKFGPLTVAIDLENRNLYRGR